MRRFMFSVLLLATVVGGLWAQVAFSFKSEGSSVLENGIGFDLGYYYCVIN
jgi:hypothetical protein